MEEKNKSERIEKKNLEIDSLGKDGALRIYTEDKPKYILLEKTKALYTRMHFYLELFPKSEKFTLRQKIEEGVLQCIRLLILQNYQQTDEERKKLMLRFLSEIYLIEVLVHQAVIFKYISYDGFDKIKPLMREINSFALSRYRNLDKSLKSGGENENI